MNLKTNKPQETNSNAEFSYDVRTQAAFYVVEVRKVGATEVLGSVSISREEKPELVSALESAIPALGGYVARAMFAGLAA